MVLTCDNPLRVKKDFEFFVWEEQWYNWDDLGEWPGSWGDIGEGPDQPGPDY